MCLYQIYYLNPMYKNLKTDSAEISYELSWKLIERDKAAGLACKA